MTRQSLFQLQRKNNDLIGRKIIQLRCRLKKHKVIHAPEGSYIWIREK